MRGQAAPPWFAGWAVSDDSLRGKTDTSMRNEALAKIVWHNLCCVIGAWYELGIEPGNWAPKGAIPRPLPEPDDGPHDVLRFPAG